MNTPTPPLEELTILLGAASYWADAEADEDHPDPMSIVCDAAREADGMIQALPRCYHRAPQLEAAATLALDLIKATWPMEHGKPQVGTAWGALESALGVPPA